jgi:transient receptor potential cation channel subfamily M protein 3
VVVVLEGGFNTLRTVADYLHDEPSTPVVIFSGTGRTSDLITLVLKRINSGMDVEQTKEEICGWMVKLYATSPAQSTVLFTEVKRIVARRNLVISNAS